MRNPDGLDATEMPAFHEALARPQDCEVVARVLTVNRAFVGDLEVLSGQVDGNAEEVVARRCGLTVLDDAGYFDGPSMDLMVQVLYRVNVTRLRTEEVSDGIVPDLPEIIPFSLGGTTVTVDLAVPAEVPVFTGPVIRPPTRNGPEVTLECQDRAAIAMRGRPGKGYPKQRNTVDTIKQILRDCGETQFDFPTEHRAKTDDAVNVGWDDNTRPWVQAQKLAASIDRHLFYDGAGKCRLRKFPDDPVIDLTDLVTSQGPPEPPSEIVNRVKVVGKRAKDHTVVRELPAGHPLSPESLKVNGVKQFFTLEETDSKLNTVAKARARADRLMRQAENKLIETRTYNLVPVPHLDPFDPVTVGADTATMLRWSFPLTASGDMTLGYDTPLVRR